MKKPSGFVRRVISIAAVVAFASSTAFATGSGEGAGTAVDVAVLTDVGVRTETIVPVTVTVVDQSKTKTVLQTENSFRSGDLDAALSVRTGDTTVDNTLKTGDNTLQTGDNTLQTGDNTLQTGDNTLKGGNIDFKYAPTTIVEAEKKVAKFVTPGVAAAGQNNLHADPTQTAQVNGIPLNFYAVEDLGIEYTENNTIHIDQKGISGDTYLIFNSLPSYINYATKDVRVRKAKPVVVNGRQKVLPLGVLTGYAVAQKQMTDMGTVIRDQGMFLLQELRGYDTVCYALVKQSVAAPNGVRGNGSGASVGAGGSGYVGNVLSIISPALAKQGSDSHSSSEIGETALVFVPVADNDSRGVWIDAGQIDVRYQEFNGKTAASTPSNTVPPAKTK